MMILVRSRSSRDYLIGIALLTTLLTWLAWNTNASHMGYVLTHRSDTLGYYQWLPGTFITQDWDSFSYVHYLGTGKGLNLFTLGVALLQAPFFLLALAYCWITGIPATGYELPFVFFRFVAAGFYGSIGLALTFHTLRRYTSVRVSLVTIILLLFATNMYYYVVRDGGMSHVYSFFLFAWLFHNTLNMVERPNGPSLFGLFVSGTLIILVRPLNGIALLLPLFYGVPWRDALKDRLQWIVRFPGWSFAGMGLALLLVLPQLLYWKAQTGSYLVFTYGAKGEGFFWWSPHLWDILFSHQGGWLLYHPVMVGAMVMLLRGACSGRPAYADWRTILLVWVVAWYLIASWWNWWLGGSFGHRGFVEHYALLALPLAACVDALINWSRRFKWLLLVPAVFLIFLNIRMSHLAFSPMDGPTWTWDSLITFWGDAFYQ
ncbi:MAG: hypothetical protein R2811_06440 [Flavobacteriales bacterium]